MVHDLLDRVSTKLTDLAVTGLANAGPARGDLDTLADDLAAARLGKLGDRLRAVAQAPDDRAGTVAWAAAWAGAGLVRTRLLKPRTLEVRDALALPQAPGVCFPRPAAGDLESVDGLLAVLQGPEPLARAYAAGRLVALGDEAVPGLLQVQATCGRCIRFLVVEALGRIGTEATVAGLVGLLGDDDVARLLEAALLGFGERAGAPVAGALANLKGAKRTVQKRRRAAAKLLWRLGAKEPLLSCVNDDDEFVRAYLGAATWSDRRLSAHVKKARGLMGFPAVVSLFERQVLALDDVVARLDILPKNHLSDAAAVLWHTSAESPVRDRALAQMTGGRRKGDRVRAAVLVAYLADRESLGLLLRLLEANGAPTWDALAELADGTAVWPLIRAAERWSIHQRAPFVSALGRIGDPAAVPALLRMLEEAPERSRRDTVGKALVAIGAPAVGAVGQKLLSLGTVQGSLAPALERVLTGIGTPEARAALAAYREGTDDQTRLLAHLADGKVPRRVIGQAAAFGADVLDPLLNMVPTARVEGQKNAIRVLVELSPALDEEQRARVVDVLTRRLGAQRQHTSNTWPSWSSNSLAVALVTALCELDASSAAPQIRDALGFTRVGDALVRSWRRTRQPWLLDVVAQGIQTPAIRFNALHVARSIDPEPQSLQVLWPPTEAVLQTETRDFCLQAAVNCVQAWGDPRAVPLLQALKGRLASVTGQTWRKNRLAKELDQALEELVGKRSLLDRLRGRR